MPSKTERPARTQAEAVLDRLERAVRRSDGFTLAFVKSNHPAERRSLCRALLGRLSDKRILEVDLDKPVISLLDEVTARWNGSEPPDAVCVYGLERSVDEQCETSPVLGRLNHDRELLRRAIPAALLIWLPDFALDCIARGAPDFWAWRSGVYEFTTDNLLWQIDSAAALAPDHAVLYSLTAAEKRKEIARLEELVRTARALPQQGKREQDTTARLLNQIGLLHLYAAEWDAARARLQESLEIWRQLGGQEGMAIALHNLGTIQQSRGNLREAEQLYRQSLRIDEALGNKSNVAVSLGTLGTVLRRQGKVAEAQRVLGQSLRIHEDLGNRGGAANSVFELGRIQQDRGDMGEAERLYRQSLQLSQDAGDKGLGAANLHQLGIIRQSRGDLKTAEQLYEQSLQISKELGNKSGLAKSWAQLGALFEEQGELRQALRHYVEAWSLFREWDSPYASQVQQRVVDVRERAGEERFREWLEADSQGQARWVIPALEEEVDQPSESVVIKG